MAATDVRQVVIDFGGQDYFQSFPKLEKRGTTPKRGKPNWRSTGAGEISIEETAAAEVEQQILIEDPRRESIQPGEIVAEEVTDQETPYEEEREIQEKELEYLDLDGELQKLDDRSQELRHEEEQGIVSATENWVENPQKSSHDVEEEREPSTIEEVAEDGDDDYIFFGTFRTLTRRPKNKVIIQEEREAAVELEEPSESNDRVEEREVIQQKSDDAENQETESNREEIEGVVSAIVEIPQEPTTDVEEGTTQESEAEGKEGVVSAIDQIPQKATTDVEEGAAQEKDTLDNEAQELGDEREINDGEGGERESQELAVSRQEEEKAQKIEAEKQEEETSFGGKNYDHHFPKMERKGRITKRERRGEFQN